VIGMSCDGCCDAEPRTSGESDGKDTVVIFGEQAG